MSDPIHSTYTYIGRRTLADGRISYAYLVGDDVAQYKKPLVGAAVGQTIQVTYGDESRRTVFTGGANRPTVTGMAEVDEAELLSWQVADRAAYEAKAQADAMKRVIKSTSFLDQHIDALSSAAARMTASERAAFARYVAQRIQ